MRLYERWAEGGVSALIIVEVQGNSSVAEKPGNLVLRWDSPHALFKELARRGSSDNCYLWLQLGHAGAMAFPPISRPVGPSAIEIPGLRCAALATAEIQGLPAECARTAVLAQNSGFGGVQIHAAHGFLLSQFLSPLFNKRVDGFGGSISSRMRLLLEVVDAVRAAVKPEFVVTLKLNATDQLEGGFGEQDALDVISALDATRIDLVTPDPRGYVSANAAQTRRELSGQITQNHRFVGRSRAQNAGPTF